MSRKKKVDYPTMELPERPMKNGIPISTGNVPDAEGQLEVFADPNQSPVAPPPPGKARIMVIVPILAVSYEFFESFLRFWTSLVTRPNQRYEVCYQFAYRRPAHMAQEALISAAIYNKCTHALFMDDDIYDVTPEMLDLLFDADKDVIAGIMHASKFPHATCAFRRYDTTKKVIDMPVDESIYRLYEIPCLCPKCGANQAYWDAKFCAVCGAPMDNLIQQVDLVPFCFTLMRLSIFEKLRKPWFHCTNGYPTDSWFADRMLEAGLVEHAHMGIRLNHNGVSDLTKPYFMQMGMERARRSQAVVELQPAEMEKHQALLHGKMMDTERRLKEKPEIVFDGHVVANKKESAPVTLVTRGH